MPIRQIGDSVAPATITSASPSTISRLASPMAWAPVEHAVTTEWLGPLRPCSIETYPEARLIRRPGMKNGDTLRGPRCLRSSAVSAMPARPPIPEPIMVPVAQRSSSVAGCQLASSSACFAALTAKMMKSSTLRWSFGSIPWSGLKVPSLPLPRGTVQAIRLVRSDTSNVSIFLAPLSLLRMRLQVGSTPQPRGDTMPRPVTTTRLISTTPTHDSRPKTRNRWTVRPRPGRFRQHRARASAFRVLFEKFHGGTDRQNGLRAVIANFATEFSFERHHELDGIEAVGAEVINEARVVDHF